MIIAFFGIFVYGLLAALPGSVLPTLERNQYLPSDSAAGTFLLINAIGAVLAYLVSGPIIDRIGKKFALLFGSTLVIASMIGFALIVTKVHAAAALLLIFGLLTDAWSGCKRNRGRGSRPGRGRGGDLA